MNGNFDVRADPITVARDMKDMGEQAKGDLPGKWAENFQHLAGYMTDSTKAAVRALSTGEMIERLAGEMPGTVTVANRLFPAANRLIARVIGMVNGFQISPATADERDRDAALAAEKLAAAQWYSERMFDDVAQAVLFAFAASHGYILCEGDATLGETMLVADETGAVVTLPTGRVVRTVLTAFDLEIVPGLRRLEDSPVIRVCQGVLPQDAERRWGAVPDGAPRFMRDKHDMASLDKYTESALVEIVRLWFKPDVRLWPRGKAYVLCGEKVLWESLDWIGIGNPDNVASCVYPVVDFGDIPVNFGYWGRGRQAVARGPQKILNVAWSKAAQVANLPGLIIAAATGSTITQEKITNAPVSMIRFNPAGGPVQFWTPPRMPLYEWVIEKCNAWIDEAYSQPPPSRGISPGSRFPAQGLQMLMEQAELADTPFGRLTLDAVSRLMRVTLIEGRRVWPDTMIDYVLGDNGRWQRVAFKKADLSEGFDVRVQPDTGVPQSRAARLDAVSRLAQFGLLGNMQDPESQKRARRLAHVWTEDDALEPDRAHEANAKDEEACFRRGEKQAVKPYDLHPVHIRLHVTAAAERSHLMREATPEQAQTYTLEEKARVEHIIAHHMAMQPPTPEVPVAGPPQAQAGVPAPTAQQPPFGSQAPPPGPGGPEEASGAEVTGGVPSGEDQGL